MKIEVEINDVYYPALQKMFPGQDIGIMISGLMEATVILFATHPEEFVRVFGKPPGEGEFAEHAEHIMKQIMEKAKHKEE